MINNLDITQNAVKILKTISAEYDWDNNLPPANKRQIFEHALFKCARDMNEEDLQTAIEYMKSTYEMENE